MQKEVFELAQNLPELKNLISEENNSFCRGKMDFKVRFKLPPNTPESTMWSILKRWKAMAPASPSTGKRITASRFTSQLDSKRYGASKKGETMFLEVFENHAPMACRDHKMFYLENAMVGKIERDSDALWRDVENIKTITNTAEYTKDLLDAKVDEAKEAYKKSFV